MISSLAANAQSWDWGDCLDWFRYEGVEILATYAHPTNSLKDFTITQTSPDIIVKIDFNGTFVDFSATYKVERGYYNNKPLFKNVRILSERTLIKSFSAWDGLPKAHGYVYNEGGFYRIYGPRDFESLSVQQKAAFGLTMEFLVKQ